MMAVASGRRIRWVASGFALTLVVLWLVVRANPGTPQLTPQHLSSTQDYLPGVAADTYLPSPPSRHAPVVVLVPGGAWRSADRTGLGPLADSLAARGMLVVNATYRAADAGVRFPAPVSDIGCAVDFAVDQARRHGVVPDGVFMLGHSSGAALAALAALEPARFRHDCPYRPAAADGFIGLAGPYDLAQWQSVAEPLFGASASEEPGLWREADPMTWVTSRTGADPLAVLLAHGTEDGDVPTSASRSFADALRAAGHPVQLTIVPGATHASIYSPEVISGTIADWIGGRPEPA